MDKLDTLMETIRGDRFGIGGGGTRDAKEPGGGVADERGVGQADNLCRSRSRYPLAEGAHLY